MAALLTQSDTHVRISAPPNTQTTPIVTALLFTLLPPLFGLMALWDSGFMNAIEGNPLLLVWLSPFFFICVFIGIVSLSNSIRQLRFPPFIEVNSDSRSVLLRFWGGSDKYDESYSFRDIQGFELVDQTDANEISLQLWADLAKRRRWSGSFSSANPLSRKPGKQTEAQRSKGKASPAKERQTPHFLKVSLSDNTSRVIKELTWNSKEDAERAVNALAEPLAN